VFTKDDDIIFPESQSVSREELLRHHFLGRTDVYRKERWGRLVRKEVQELKVR